MCALPSSATILCAPQLDMRPYSRTWGPLHPFPIAYAVSRATRPRRPSLGLAHSLLPPTPVPLEALRGCPAFPACAAPPVVPFRPCRTHRSQAHHDRLHPDSALTSRRLHLRASSPRFTRPPACPAPATAFLLASVSLVA